MGVVCASGGQCLNAGYLTVQDTLDSLLGRYELRIPNKEIMSEFSAITAHYLHVDENSIDVLTDKLLQKDWKGFLNGYRKILMDTISYFDLVNENSYQTLLLGLLMRLGNAYEISSNREHGEGRYDILLSNKTSGEPSLLFELKYTKDENIDLTKLAKLACDQIIDKKYDHDMQNVIKVGLAHRGKQVEMYVHA